MPLSPLGWSETPCVTQWLEGFEETCHWYNPGCWHLSLCPLLHLTPLGALWKPPGHGSQGRSQVHQLQGGVPGCSPVVRTIQLMAHELKQHFRLSLHWSSLEHSLLSKQSFGLVGPAPRGSGQPSGQVRAERWARGHCPLARWVRPAVGHQETPPSPPPPHTPLVAWSLQGLG